MNRAKNDLALESKRVIRFIGQGGIQREEMKLLFSDSMESREEARDISRLSSKYLSMLEQNHKHMRNQTLDNNTNKQQCYSKTFVCRGKKSSQLINSYQASTHQT